ncbi:hypothetical protein [Georgfuchsia toluolica]|uniref:hypothetical protein n=1 Tax=Georgfuchsia toluolica TaxID=424218 RepID=UPI001C732206|nr:hypothetical protein [Georgfuchsia toluolica]
MESPDPMPDTNHNVRPDHVDQWSTDTGLSTNEAKKKKTENIHMQQRLKYEKGHYGDIPTPGSSSVR